MRNHIILLAVALAAALSSCNQKQETAFDLGSDKIAYTVDYEVAFAAAHDSTMQLKATSNYGTAKVVSVASDKLLDAHGKTVKNTFITLEDSVPAGKSIMLSRGALSYGGGKPEYIHVHTVGSDDMVELRILDANAITHSHTNALTHSRTNALPHSHTNALTHSHINAFTTLYSIRDNMFYDPYEQQTFTIPGGHRFSVVLPVMTEEQFPAETEKHTIHIGFEIKTDSVQ